MRLDNRTTRLVVSDVPAAEMGTTKEYFKVSMLASMMQRARLT
jgi:hypothetical protein